MKTLSRTLARSRAMALAASALAVSPFCAPMSAAQAMPRPETPPPPPPMSGEILTDRDLSANRNLFGMILALFNPPGGNASPVLPAAPGAAQPWQPALPVHSGSANLATGNLTLVHPVAGWDSLGPAVRFALVFNSQAGTAAGPVGPKWRHSYMKSVAGLNPAVLSMPDGRTQSFALSNGQYLAPAGIDLDLVRNPDSSWHLTTKDQTRYRFDASGRLVEVRDRNLNAKSLAYDAAGRLATVTDAVGRTLQIAYNGSGQIATVRDFENRVWTISYNAAGRPSSVADPLMNGLQFQTQFGYNAGGNVASLTNRLGHTWTYAYDGNVFRSATAPGGATSGAVHNTVATTVMDFQAFTADAADGQNTPDQQAGTWPVDTARIASTQNEAGNVTEYGLDAAGRVTAMRAPTGEQTNFAWNTQNRRTQITEPGGATTTLVYDARGNVTSTTDPLGRTSTAVYDAQNNRLSQTDALGQTTAHTYDARGNRLSSTDPTGRTTSQTYNANGTVATRTDAGGYTSTFSYNAQGEMTQSRDPLNNVTSFAYANGRVASRTDAMGRTTLYAYDGWGRLAGIDYPSSVDQTFAYDAEGRLVQAVDGTGTRTFSYNARGFKTGQTDPRGNTTATYDAAGRMLTQTDVTGRTIQYAYDAAGRLVQVQDPTSWAQYAYDARGRRVATTLSNGVVSTWTYDAASQPTALTHRQGANGPVVASFTGTYDAAGRLTQMAEAPASATTTMAYDAAGRLLAENRTGASPYASTYTYDARGLRATAFRSESGVASHNGTYTYDAAGRLTLVTQPGQANEVYTWNADSTLASLPGPGHTRNLQYDEEGRMVSLSRGGAPAFEFGYGFDGARRFSRDVAAGSTSWLPCGVRCSAGELAELVSTDGGTTWSAASTNLSAPSCGGGLVRAGGQFVLRDLRGAVSRTVSSTGTVTATAVFDALGVQRSGTGALASGVIRDAYGNANEDGMTAFLAGRGIFDFPRLPWPNIAAVGICLYNLFAKEIAICVEKLVRGCRTCLYWALGGCVLFPKSCAGWLLRCKRPCGDDVARCAKAITDKLREKGIRTQLALCLAYPVIAE